MAHEIARHTGQHVVARLLDLAQDEEVIERVSTKWSREAQRVVGAAVIRFVFWVVGIVALIVAWKAGLVHAISEAIGSGRQS
jgi:predicted phage tail protein